MFSYTKLINNYSFHCLKLEDHLVIFEDNTIILGGYYNPKKMNSGAFRMTAFSKNPRVVLNYKVERNLAKAQG